MKPVFFASFLAAVLPAVLTAQMIPGGQSVDVDLQRAQFNAVMIKVIRQATGAWQEAWAAPDANRLAQHYADEAALVQLGGELVSGGAGIRAALDSLRGRVSEARLAFTDYDSSEGIAYFYGPFEMEPRAATIATIHGHHLTVLKRDRTGYRVRMQLFHPASGTPHLPTYPELHPSGPLTLDLMKKPASVARYRSASALINQLHLAWARPDTAALLELFTPDALVQMPGQPAGVKGSQASKDLLEFRARTSALHMVTLDYDNSSRITSLLGRYLFELPSGSTFQGYFAVILAGKDDDWKIRALILL